MNNADYTQSTLSLPQAARWLTDTPGPTLVVTHAKPDGDAFGSTIALVAALTTLGQTARGLFVPPLPDALGELAGADLADVWDADYRLPFNPGRIVIVDTGAWSQIGPLRETIEPHLDDTLILDHHLSGNVSAGHRYVDGQAAAACEIIAELIDLLLAPSESKLSPSDSAAADASAAAELRRVIDDALFVGIASDTGWFRFSNVRPQTHRLAADLIGRGVDHATLYQKLEQCERPEKLALHQPGVAKPDLPRRRPNRGVIAAAA